MMIFIASYEGNKIILLQKPFPIFLISVHEKKLYSQSVIFQYYYSLNTNKNMKEKNNF